MRDQRSDRPYNECPCCGAEAFVREEAIEAPPGAFRKQSVDFWSCSVCGWTKHREKTETPEGVQVVELYDVDAIPLLARRKENSGPWEHSIDDQHVSREDWEHEMEARKQEVAGVLN
jgi:transcription elongation factor Elf1